MEIKAVIFDYGNVLTYPQSNEYITKMANILGVAKKDFLKIYFEHRDHYDSGKINGLEYWQIVSASLNVSVQDKQIFNQLIEADLNSWFQLNDNVWNLVLRLKKDYLTALLSNNINELVAKIESEILLDKYFDLSIFSNRLPFIKPEPEIYHYCLDKLGLKPFETVFIDDKMINVEAAEKIGINAVLFTDYQNLLIKLNELLGESYGINGRK